MSTLRDVRAGDLETLRVLNNAEVPHVSGVDLGALTRYTETAPYFRVAERDGDLLGFLIAMAPDSDYDSPNFLWFRARYDSFVYCDRILVSPAAKGMGLGRAFYQDLAVFAQGRAPLITCEVNTRPENPDSMAFHERLGFREVGRQQTEGGAKEVALLAREITTPPHN